MQRMKQFTCVAATVVSVWSAAIAFSARGDEGIWQTDFEVAKAKAEAEKKMLLADFTGSDWCIFCKKLKSEVLDQDVFKSEALKFVLVELDYPEPRRCRRGSTRRRMISCGSSTRSVATRRCC